MHVELASADSRLRAMQRALGAFVALALSIAIPATTSAQWFIYALWIAIGCAVALMIAFSKPIASRIPWRIQRRDPQMEASVGLVLRRVLLRADLQRALTNLDTNLKTPTPHELRAFADNLAQRLRTDGHDVKAKTLEVHLSDDADPDVVKRRRDELHLALMRMLLWDEFS